MGEQRQRTAAFISEMEGKSDGKRQISYDITYMWNLKKNDTNELNYKTEIDSQT